MVGPIAKQCLEGLGCSPSLWSLETLVNAGIILGFNRRKTLPRSTHTYTHKDILKHVQIRFLACMLVMINSIVPDSDATQVDCRGKFLSVYVRASLHNMGYS